jgi:hypothetical protein
MPCRVTRRLGKKFTQILEKVAKTVNKPKNAKISSSKLNLKVQNKNIKLLLNSSNTYNKSYFPKILAGAFKKYPKCYNFPNLVTLMPWCTVWRDEFAVTLSARQNVCGD